ncbi:hypothetical protein ABZT48_14815 [Streptomyces avermitilis]|uniref:hypothetical protein n=1 Tax=Streptomyces avermitilis TaxID=33903 RepID=UPI0033ADEBAA
MTTGLAAQHTARAARWIDILLRQFPELLEELAPGRHGATAPSRTRPGTDGGTAPVRLHVSDTIRDITDGVVELEEAVREKLGLGRPARADAPERLRRIAGLLDDVTAHPVLAGHVLDECRRMARRCGRTLGTPETLVRINGRCPWCDSVSLRALPAWRTVICVNPGCRCTDEECGCVNNPAHRHTWAETGWAQLAEESGADPREIATLVDDVHEGEAA